VILPPGSGLSASARPRADYTTSIERAEAAAWPTSSPRSSGSRPTRSAVCNKSVKSSLRTAIRRFREAVEAGDTEQIIERQRSASRALDKAAGKGVIHANQAANKKASLAHQVNSLSA
jgi:small subunit ribosomal protein S20